LNPACAFAAATAGAPRSTAAPGSRAALAGLASGGRPAAAARSRGASRSLGIGAPKRVVEGLGHGAFEALGFGFGPPFKLKEAGVQAKPARGIAPRAVALVAGYRAAPGGQLGAYLVLAPGVQLKLNKAEYGSALEHAVAA